MSSDRLQSGLHERLQQVWCLETESIRFRHPATTFLATLQKHVHSTRTKVNNINQMAFSESGCNSSTTIQLIVFSNIMRMTTDRIRDVQLCDRDEYLTR